MTTKTTPQLQLVAARFVTLLALAIWIGGILFFGAMAAPVVTAVTRDHSDTLLGMARSERYLGFIAVGAMLGRFLPVLYITGILALCAWWTEGRLLMLSVRGPRSQGSGVRGAALWIGQGACMVLMLALIIGGGLLLRPRMDTLQEALLPQLRAAWNVSPEAAIAPTTQLLPGVDPTTKALFDAAHHQFQTVTMMAWWLALVALGLFSWRSAIQDAGYKMQDTG